MRFWKCCLLVLFLQTFLFSTVLSAPAPSETTIKITNKDKLELNKKVKLQAITHVDGEIVESRFYYTVNHTVTWNIENAKTTKIGSKYYTYGSFIPKESGEYHIQFSITMKDANGNLWLSQGSTSVKIFAYDVLDVMSNPSEATAYRDQDLFLIIRYLADKEYEHQFKVDGYYRDYEEISILFLRCTDYVSKHMDYLDRLPQSRCLIMVYTANCFGSSTLTRVLFFSLVLRSSFQSQLAINTVVT